MRSRCWVMGLGLALALLPRAAGAHPADEASVYHYLWLEARPGELALQHATVVGGLVTTAVWPQIDRNHDNELSDAEIRAHAGDLAASLSVRIDGRPAHWKLVEQGYPSKTEFFGRNMAALTLRLTTPLPPVRRAGVRVHVEDGTFPIFTGVFPQPVLKSDGMAVAEVVVRDEGRAAEFRLIPGQGEGLGGDPSSAIQASPGAGAPPPESTPGLPRLNPKQLFPERGKVVYAGPQPEGAHEDTRALKGFLDRPLTPGILLLAIAAALIAGAAHALTPGHGKTMVAAYLVGARGTVKDAVLLGIVVTLTHTAGVYVLGALCLWLTTRIRAEVVGQWLSLTSGLLVLGMGFWLFQRGLLHFHGLRALPGHAHGAGGHSHGGGEAHTHGQEGHTHTHGAEGDPEPPHDAPLTPAPEAARDVRRGVIALGVAGGIVPCFDALAVLIAAVNLGRVELGLLLIAAFSVGMALVLVAIGILMVKAKDVMARFTSDGPLVRALPAASGAVLFLLGAWLTFQSLVHAGVLRVG